MSRVTLPGVARAVVFLGAFLAYAWLFPQGWLLDIGFFTLMYATLAVAWNLFGGYTGYVSLGHVAFFGLGAYAEAILFNHWSIGAGGLNPFFALPLVGLGVGIVSVPIAWIALRTRAMTFAIVTLTLLFVVQDLGFNLTGITHGAQGISIPPPNFSLYERPFYLAVLALLAFTLLVSWYVRGSKLGLTLLAVREDEDKARGVGVRTTGAKVFAFALSVGVTAMVGAVWAYYIFYIYPEYAVDPLVMIGSILPVFLGGRGTLWGPVLGTVILVPTQQFLAQQFGATEWYLVVYAAVFLVIMLLLPAGILPSVRGALDRRRDRARPRAAPTEPAVPERAAS